MPDSKPQTTDPRDILSNARHAVREHLSEVASEILAWRATGLLPNGRLREIAATLRELNHHDHLGLAEKLAVDAALEAASGKS